MRLIDADAFAEVIASVATSELPIEEIIAHLEVAPTVEQDPVEPHVEHDSDDDSWYYGCGACHDAIDYKDKFCRHCGREVKWDAAD